MTGSNAENVTNVTPGAIDLSQNPASAYYLHAGENPGLVLVAQLLTGNNYHSWSREFKRALRAKNKLSFVDGSLSMPAEGDVNRPAWDRCNTMICSWISRSVDSSIAKSIHWFENCSDVWSNLEKRFSQGNSIKISDLQEQMYTFTQGSMSVTDYYTQLMTLWEELINYRPLLLCKCLPTCKCSNLLVTAKAYQEEDLVLRFLKGLNPDYSGARSQIFLIKPLPEITSVLSLVLQQERQNQPSCLQLEPSINLVKDQNYEKKKFKCSHCDKPGHTIDQCYRKHGFPANFKFTKAKKGNVTGNVTSGGCNLEDVNFDSGSVVPVSSTVSASSNEGSGVFLSKAQYARLLGMLDAPDQRPKQHTQHNHVIGNVVSGHSSSADDWFS